MHLKPRRATLASAAVVAVLAPALLAFAPANAATSADDIESTALAVYNHIQSASDPEAAFHALPASEQSAFNDYFLAVSSTESVTLTPTDAAAVSAVNSGKVGTHYTSLAAAQSALAAAAVGCWGSYVGATEKSALGVALFTTYTEGTWCYSGVNVTSAAFSRSWATISYIGWSDKGQIGAGAGVANNRGKIWSQRKMVFGAGGWDIQTLQPCVRLVGLGTGQVSVDYVCSIY